VIRDEDKLPQPHPADHPKNEMWLDEQIWGHRLWDNQSPWLLFLECLCLAEAIHREGKLLNHGTNYYPLTYHPAQRLYLRNILFNNEVLFEIAERSSSSPAAWKEWLKWMDDNAKGVNPRDFSYLQPRFHSFGDFAALVGMLRASAVESDANKRWSSRFVFPFGDEALYEDLNVTTDGKAAREHINFGRTGELLYMMLARSSKATELVGVLTPMVAASNPWNTLLKLLQPEPAGERVKSDGAFLPYARHAAFERIAEDWLAISRLRLPGFDAYPHLVTLSAFGVLLYELDVACEIAGRPRPHFVCEIVGPRKTLVRELSTQNYQENHLLPETALKAMIKRVEESAEWKSAANDAAAFSKCKEILVERFRWPTDEEDYDNCTTPEALISEFRKKAISRHRQHVGNVHRNYGRDAGLVSKRGTNRLRYAPNDNLLKALILANVEWRMEFNEFLELLCDRYGLVLGDRAGARFLGAGEFDQKNFRKNAERLEQRLTSLGMLHRLSDACAYVKNPFGRSRA
jgi:hypothetical protein